MQMPPPPPPHTRRNHPRHPHDLKIATFGYFLANFETIGGVPAPRATCTVGSPMMGWLLHPNKMPLEDKMPPEESKIFGTRPM